jgi:23S rRNA pseudouridine1911/1915/1917 synthase
MAADSEKNPLPEIETSDLQVLFHDGPTWVVMKPAGVATQAPERFDSMESRIRNYWRQIEQKEGRIYVGVPHRLDRPVSGALIFARHVRAASRIANQFAERRITKEYLALVEGTVQEPQGTWRDFIRKIPNTAKVELVSENEPGCSEAISNFQVIGQNDQYTLLSVAPETGRMHQIRIQTASRGHPIAGDLLYGAHSPFGPPNDDPRSAMIALHALRLTFLNPMRKETVDVIAPLPLAWTPWQAWVGTAISKGGVGSVADTPQ